MENNAGKGEVGGGGGVGGLSYILCIGYQQR